MNNKPMIYLLSIILLQLKPKTFKVKTRNLLIKVILIIIKIQ